MFSKYNLKKYNILLILNVLLLVAIGVVAIGSATRINTELGSDAMVRRQIQGLIFGFIGMVVVSFIDYRFIGKFYIPIYLFMNGLLVMVLIFGKTVNNAKRWVEIGGITLQPSELAKLLLIIVFAKLIDRFHKKFNKPWFLLILMVIGAVPVFLINIQPDLSTSIMVIIIVLLTIFVGGLDFRYILAGLLIGVPLIYGGFWYIQQPTQELLEPYQVNRIMSLINPENASESDLLQTNNSIQAIGSGQLNGKGLYQGKLNQYSYLPEPQTDFIFSIIGEEFGFVGCTVVIGLIFLLVFQILWVGIGVKDVMATVLIGGIAGMIGMQTFVNIGVTTGVLPNTGLPLPFISYGLSSLLTNMLAIGFIINIGLQKKTKLDEIKAKRG